MKKRNVLITVTMIIILLNMTLVIMLRTQRSSIALGNAENIVEYEFKIENTDEIIEELDEEIEIEETKEEIIESPVVNDTQIEKTDKVTSTTPTVSVTTNVKENNSKETTPINIVTTTEIQKQETVVVTETKPIQEPEIEKCTNDGNHGIGVGNCGKWYSSKSEGIADYDNKQSYWGKLWTNYEIDTVTYDKNCPSRYEIYSCKYCGKWTLDYFYRQ